MQFYMRNCTIAVLQKKLQYLGFAFPDTEYFGAWNDKFSLHLTFAFSSTNANKAKIILRIGFTPTYEIYMEKERYMFLIYGIPASISIDYCKVFSISLSIDHCKVFSFSLVVAQWIQLSLRTKWVGWIRQIQTLIIDYYYYFA